MAKYEYSKYKIIIDPESKKVQGLRVGDVVRRQYFDAPNLIYSLMVVLDAGVDAINGKESHYFVGALLEGDEPKTGELLDFVRVTSLCDKERGGALYLTASDSESPFMDVIDGLGFENSLLYQPKVQRFSREQKYLLGGDVGYPEMLLVAYRVRASEQTTTTVSVGYSDEIDGVDEVEVSTEWQYKLSAIVIDYPEQYQRELTITTDAEWCEIEHLNVVRLSDVATFAKATKARIGKITGIVDPIFGKLEGYGAYFQNLYATRNVNIAGTLTAGDENGFASTFYVGKIHKNTIINSLECNFSNSTIINESSPVGIGKVRQITNDTTLTAQTSDWREERIGKLYTFSIWIKGVEQSITLYQDEHRIGSITPQSNDWQRHKITFEIQSSDNPQMTLRIEGASENTLITAPQLEAGEYVSQYQPTDSTLNETEDYGAWFTKGGIGGTIQNPLLKLNEDGSISSIDDSFVINQDGTGHFAGGRFAWTKDTISLKDITIRWEDLDEEAKENMQPVLVQVHSSQGTTFRNGQISTLLTAKVIRGAEDITDQIHESEFRWFRSSDNSYADDDWNEPPRIGKSIEINQEDITFRATFDCEVNINISTL